MNPAAYPASSVPEMKSIQALLSLLDVEFVKPDAKWLDKVPNFDGAIELTDEHQVPIGKLDVQIKTLRENETKFQCPSELVAYSMRTSNPFILLCVDASQKKAFWRLLNATMPEFKQGQDSFVIHFRSEIDEVGPCMPYLSKWREICSDYQSRISEYPRLTKIFNNDIGLSEIDRQDRILFQAFIDEINSLLDFDFPVIKAEYFADTWKIGVSVQWSDKKSIRYSLYSIRNGENAPLIIHSPEDLKKQTSENPFSSKTAAVGHMYSTKGHFGDGLTTARQFVFGYIQKALAHKKFRICGQNQCAEQLLWFIENYGQTLGISQANEYELETIIHGLHVYFPIWYSITFSRTIQYMQANYAAALSQVGVPFFESIVNLVDQTIYPSDHEVRTCIVSKKELPQGLLRSSDFSFRTLLEAADCLSLSGCKTVRRIYKPKSRQGAWLWDLYTFEDIVHNARTAYEGAVADYPVFFSGNRFGRLRTRFDRGHLALIVAIYRLSEKNNHKPAVKEIWVKNEDAKLPPLTFIDLTMEPDAFIDRGFTVSLHGVEKKLILGSENNLDFLWRPRPIETLLFQWLKEDIEDAYQTRFH